VMLILTSNNILDIFNSRVDFLSVDYFVFAAELTVIYYCESWNLIKCHAEFT